MRQHLALIGYLILAAFIVGALYRGYQIDRRAARDRAAIEQRFARSDAKQLAVIRTILCLAAHQTQTSKQRTPGEKARSSRFYNDALHSVNARPCDKEK